MTKDLVQKINIGGVEFNSNAIKSSKEVENNGKKSFIVSFKNGTTIEYPQQAKKNDAKVVGGKIGGENRSVFTRISNAKISGSKGADHIVLNGCNCCFVDLANDSAKADTVVFKDSQKDGTKWISMHNRAKLDKNDIGTVQYEKVTNDGFGSVTTESIKKTDVGQGFMAEDRYKK